MPFRQLVKKRWVKFTLEIAFFVLLFIALRAYMQKDMVRGEAPPIQAVTLSGAEFSLQDSTRPILVHFWATWCGICKLEQGSIESISRDYPVMTIAMQSGSNEEIQAFLEEHQLTFAVINDDDGELSRQYGVSGVPASFIIASNGEIVSVERGYTTEWGLRARLWLAK